MNVYINAIEIHLTLKNSTLFSFEGVDIDYFGIMIVRKMFSRVRNIELLRVPKQKYALFFSVPPIRKSRHCSFSIESK